MLSLVCAVQAPAPASAGAAMSSASGLGGKEVPSAFSVDLAAAARRLLLFLRAAPAGVGPRSVRRYEELWMPLAAEKAGVGGEAAMLVPPPDVHLVWLCHCFHHVSLLLFLATFSVLQLLPESLSANHSATLFIRTPLPLSLICGIDF